MGDPEEQEQTLDAWTTESLKKEVIERETNIEGDKPRLNRWALLFILVLVTYTLIFLIPYFMLAGFFDTVSDPQIILIWLISPMFFSFILTYYAFNGNLIIHYSKRPLYLLGVPIILFSLLLLTHSISKGR